MNNTQSQLGFPKFGTTQYSSQQQLTQFARHNKRYRTSSREKMEFPLN